MPNYEEMPDATPNEQNTTHYNVPDEPLRNPEFSFKQALEQLKKDNWQEIFEALNTIKRIA